MHLSLNRETINQNSFQQILILIALVFPVANYTRSSLHSYLIVVFTIWPLPLIQLENLAHLILLMLSFTFSCLGVSNQSLPSRSLLLNSHHWLHQIPSLNSLFLKRLLSLSWFTQYFCTYP